MNNTVNYSKIEKRAKVLDGVRKALIYFLLSVWGIVVLFPLLDGTDLRKKLWSVQFGAYSEVFYNVANA